MDVVGLSRLGLDIGVATCGTSLTPSHMKLMKRYTQNLYLLFDNDPAGFDATVRGLKIAYEQDTYPKILALPAGYKDVDEWANVSPSESDISAFFAGAEDGVIFVMKELIKRYDDNSPVERKRVIEQLFGILLYIQDLTVLAWYLEKMASHLSISADILKQQFDKFGKTQTMVIKGIQKNKGEKQPVRQSEEFLFASFFYQEFLSKMNISSPKLHELTEFVKELSLLQDDETLKHIFAGEVSSELKEQLLETQLYMERQWDTHTEDKKLQDVLSLCQRYIQTSMKNIMKLPKIGAEKKQELLEKMRNTFLAK